METSADPGLLMTTVTVGSLCSGSVQERTEPAAVVMEVPVAIVVVVVVVLVSEVVDLELCALCVVKWLVAEIISEFILGHTLERSPMVVLTAHTEATSEGISASILDPYMD